jgi:hypothetical protein
MALFNVKMAKHLIFHLRPPILPKLECYTKFVSHPSLQFKNVVKFWSVRIGASYRALAIEDGKDFIWVWIGTHDEYERMIKDMG